MTTNPYITRASQAQKEWEGMKAQVIEMMDGEIDEKCLIDTLEGSTDMTALLLEIENEIAEDDARIEAIAIRQKELSGRKTRLEKRIDSYRGIILMCMDKNGIQRIEGSDCTISIKTTPPKLEVTDEAQIPATFFIVPDPKLDKAALSKALKDGQSVEGARLTESGVTIQIRRS